MNWLSRLSVGAKLTSITVIALFALAATSANSLVALRSAASAATHAMDNDVAAVTRLGQARAAVGNMRRYEKDLFLNMGDEKAAQGYLKHWRAEVVKGEELMKSCQEVLVVEERPQVAAMLTGLANYRNGFEGLVKSLESGTLNDPLAANKAMTPLKGDVRAMDAALDALSASVNARVTA